MPVITQEGYESTALQRAIVYGEPLTRKTWWCARAAEFGYNVILADFDNGYHVCRNLPLEAQHKIFRIDCRMPADPKNKNSAFTTLALAARGGVTYYDELARVKATPKSFESERLYTKFDLMSATHRDVLIVDSWTSLTHQIAEFNDTSIDVTKVADYTEQSVYKVLRTHADRLITNLQRLPCHVIFICHAAEYAKRKADAKAKDKPEDAIEWIKTTPVSVTKDHGRQMAKDVGSVLYFDTINGMGGAQTYVATTGPDTIIAGAHNIPPMKKPWADLAVDTLLPPLPDEIGKPFNSAAVSVVSGAEILADAQSNSGAPAKLDATKPTMMKIGK